MIFVVSYKDKNCRGRLIQDKLKPESEQFRVSKEHGDVHLPNATRVGVAVARDKLKRKAEETLEPPRTIISKIVRNMDSATIAAMPNEKALRRTINRKRVDKEVPSLPTSLNDLVVPEKYLKCSDGSSFLLHDSGPGDQRILIFASEDNLSYLKRSDVILMDGTFDVVPPLFSQLYTLQGIISKYDFPIYFRQTSIFVGRINGWYVPLVYILAPNKSKKTYEQAFSAIVSKVEDLMPPHIISDFEIGAVNAAKKMFKNAEIHLCLFHLRKSIFAKVQNLGLKPRYGTDAVFSLNIRQLMALAFVPAADIQDAFGELCETSFWSPTDEDEDSMKLQELLQYFESTYVGIPTRTQSRRRSSLFHPELWSVYEVTKLGGIFIFMLTVFPLLDFLFPNFLLQVCHVRITASRVGMEKLDKLSVVATFLFTSFWMLCKLNKRFKEAVLLKLKKEKIQKHLD